MQKFVVLLVAGLLSSWVLADELIQSEHAQKTLEIYTRIVGVESSKNLGNVPEIANYLASELVAAGFPEEDTVEPTQYETVAAPVRPPARSAPPTCGYVTPIEVLI